MRRAIAAALLVVAGGTAAAVGASGGDEPVSQSATAAGGRSTTAVSAPPGSAPAFVHLSRRATNRCDLQAGEIRSMPGHHRLQGSCCSRMDQATYEHQVEHLRRYHHLAEIPRDPYDISARQAQLLLAYDRTMKLTPSQRAVYEKAMRMSREKGPCCCPCWRYDAFRGLSKHLIANRQWPAGQLAELIDALDGCGGAAGEHSHST